MLRHWAEGLPDPAGIARFLDEMHPLGSDLLISPGESHRSGKTE
jgi:hypothetical protein